MCDKAKIDELVKMMDDFVTNGGGHLEVKAEGDTGTVETTTYKSTDCALGNKACQVPTLHKGIDD
ncbi:MAG: hypothetical protein J1F64_07480 [Oscillospiraceae bacterium]|nr:hypothetical protein [Oscillospiraceae bacterium]